MAQRSRSTFKKRQKELARQQRQQDKFARRLERNKLKQEDGPAPPAGEDPDIAGIVPGPQPRQDEDEPGAGE
jgi:hypothetical protein